MKMVEMGMTTACDKHRDVGGDVTDYVGGGDDEDDGDNDGGVDDDGYNRDDGHYDAGGDDDDRAGYGDARNEVRHSIPARTATYMSRLHVKRRGNNNNIIRIENTNNDDIDDGVRDYENKCMHTMLCACM